VTIASAYLSTSSWYGHPEEQRVLGLYREAKEAAVRRGAASVGNEWNSTLVCWMLLDEEGFKEARAYEPSELTPRWVFTDASGVSEIEPPITLDEMRALMVTYRLKGGMDVDALHLQT
jgi:hypothetical protein